jgi:hypothetical protein
MLKSILAAAGLSLAVLATPVLAAPNQQLVTSVQQRLNVIGFSKVDASTLSTSQIGALHLRLQGNYTFGLNRIRTQQDVKVILNWEQ